MQNQNNLSSIVKISLLWLLPLLWYSVALFLGHIHVKAVADYNYYAAAQQWIRGEPLYSGNGFGFVYLPTTAIFLSPLAWLPVKIFALLFRIFSVALFAFGVYRFANVLSKASAVRAYFFMTLSCVLLLQAPLFEGQMHLITTGLLLLGFAGIIQEKWWQSAFCLSLAIFFKPTSIVLYLLGLALYPKLTFKLLLLTVCLFLSTFLTQAPTYVFNQYVALINSFKAVFHFDGSHPGHWATFFGSLAFYTHYHASALMQYAIRIIVAFFVLISSYVAKRKLGAQEAVFMIFALGMSYLMLFNSRTENNDYIMIMPVIGYSLAQSVQGRKWLSVGGLSISVLLLAVSWLLCKSISPSNNLWLKPTLIFIYTLYLLRQVYQQTPLSLSLERWRHA